MNQTTIAIWVFEAKFDDINRNGDHRSFNFSEPPQERIVGAPGDYWEDYETAPDAASSEVSTPDWDLRHRLLASAPDVLTDDELLEMVLAVVHPQSDRKLLAKELVARFGSFATAISASHEELRATRGMDVSTVLVLKTIQTAALRLARAQTMYRPVTLNWNELITYLHALLSHEKVEHFRILFLDLRNRLIADEPHGRGTINIVWAYPREIVKRALELEATAMILVHNHPSGDPTPSKGDVEMTDEIALGAQALGIALHDHIIIGNGTHVSLRREGLLRTRP